MPDCYVPASIPAPVCPPWPRIHIGCVAVCVDYADFLAWTLPFNRAQFDELVIVTSSKDTKTQELCTHYHVRCVVTDVMFKGDGKFHKALAINEGMKHLSKKDWVVHMDADIMLPPRAKEMLERSQPDPNFIYGIDRVNCKSFEELVDFLGEPEPQYVASAFVHQRRFEMGSRLVREQGFVPIGFFQMWHPNRSGIGEYNTIDDEYNSHCDVTHAELWPRNRRGFIPEIIALHLMSADEPHSNNWNGRRSAPFKLKGR